MCVCGGAGAQEECELYFEGFGAFAGPADFDNGAFEVRWETSGATVASSGYCPTGNALRMTDACHDPVLWVKVAGQGCTRVTLEFTYGQFADSQTFLRYALSDDTEFDAQAPTPLVAGHLDRINGLCTTAIHPVELDGEQSVYWRFDHGPVAGAFLLDSVRIVLETCDCEGMVLDHACCEEGAAGCLDDAVEACVCAIDPYCCEVEWDAQCVAEVEQFGCGSCGGSGCMESFAADFGDFFEPGTVCANFPELFESCDGIGPYTSGGSACASTADQAMYFAGGLPHSSAMTRCVDLSDVDDASLVFEYSKDALTIGPKIGVSVDGGATFVEVWTGPFSEGGACVTECIDLTEFAGQGDVRLRFSSGSAVENGATFDDVELVKGFSCGDGPRDCNGNGIDDAAEVLEAGVDRNGNGIPDGCDIAAGTSEDADGDGVPDEAGCISAYALDEEDVQDSVGLVGGGELLWMNAFVVVEGAEAISSVTWSWGDSPPSDDAVTIVVYDDPTDDGQPGDLSVLWQATVETHPAPFGLQRVAVPEVHVGEAGEVFFVGVLAEHGDGDNPAGLEAGTPVAGRSWVVGDSQSVDVVDLATNELAPTLVEAAGVVGNWAIRAGVCDCSGLYGVEEVYLVTEQPIDLNGDGAADARDALDLGRCVRRGESEGLR